LFLVDDTVGHKPLEPSTHPSTTIRRLQRLAGGYMSSATPSASPRHYGTAELFAGAAHGALEGLYAGRERDLQPLRESQQVPVTQTAEYSAAVTRSRSELRDARRSWQATAEPSVSTVDRDLEATRIFLEALNTGSTNDSWTGPTQVLESSHVSSWWNLLSPEVATRGNFSFVEFGCFDERQLLAAKVAKEFPLSTVLAVHVCESGTTEVLERVRDEGDLGNLYIGRAELGDALVSNLRSVLGRHKLACDYAVFSDLSDLARDALPFEVELKVAEALQLCKTSFLPHDLPDERLFSYWTSVDDMLERASTRLSGVTFGLKAVASASSSTRSSYTSYTSSRSSTTSGYTSSAARTSYAAAARSYSSRVSKLWRVDVSAAAAAGTNRTNGTMPASSPILPIGFLLHAGLIPVHKISLFVRLVDFLGTQPGSIAAAFGSMAVAGPLITAANATLLEAGVAGTLSRHADVVVDDSSSEGGNGSTGNSSATVATTAADATATAANSTIAGTANAVEASGTVSAAANMTTTPSTYREYLLSTLANTTATSGEAPPSEESTVGTVVNYTAGRRLLGILYDKTPSAVYGPEIDAEPIVKPRSTHRVGTFLTDTDRKAQFAMLRDEEASFGAWWSALKKELRSSECNTMLVLGK
jgi:hypothetical protein